MMFGIGTTELVVILSIVFLIFGGKKLPELGAGLGKGISSFKNGLKNAEENIPGVQEIAYLKEEVDKVKEMGSVLKKKSDPEISIGSDIARPKAAGG